MEQIFVLRIELCHDEEDKYGFVCGTDVKDVYEFKNFYRAHNIDGAAEKEVKNITSQGFDSFESYGIEKSDGDYLSVIYEEYTNDSSMSFGVFEYWNEKNGYDC